VRCERLLSASVRFGTSRKSLLSPTARDVAV
jgi:hypothetical protein